jgi:hypothetical protein
MRLVAVVVVAACVAAPSALAKFRMTMALGDSTPRAGQRWVTVAA